MTDVFVSYSRRDAVFVERLVAALRDRGRDVWMDVGGIEDAELFPQALRRAIERSDSFVFVITPDAAGSRFCEQEVDHAVGLQKRIIPLLHRPLDDEQLPAEVRDRNWISCREEDDFDVAVERLVRACDRDLDHARSHTRWLVKTLDWQAAGEDRSMLLRGSELAAAEGWLAAAGPSVDPQPTEAQRGYVLTSRRQAARRARMVTTASLISAVVAIVLVVFALLSRSEAQDARSTSRARALAATAQANLDTAPLVSQELSSSAVREKPVPEALFALRAAIDANPLLAEYPRPAASCDDTGGALAYAPGGDELVQTGCRGDVLRRDARTGRVLGRRSLRTTLRPALDISRDGGRLAIGGDEGLWILDARTLEQRRRVRTVGKVYAAAFSPDGRMLAFVDAPDGDEQYTGDVVLVDPGTGRRRTLLREGSASALAWIDGGRRLVVATNSGAAAVVDVASGRVVRRLPTGQSGYIGTVSATADGRAFVIGLATVSGKADVLMWKTDDLGRSTRVARLETAISQVAISADGARVAAGGYDGTGGVWSTADGGRLMTFGGQTDVIGSISFRPGANVVATGDLIDGVRVWRSGGPELATFPSPFTPKVQITGGFVLSRGRLTMLGPVPGRLRGAVASYDGRSGRRIDFRRLPEGSLRASYNGAPDVNGSATLTEDGREVLTSERRGGRRSLVLRSATTGAFAARLPFLDQSATSFADGNRVAVLQGPIRAAMAVGSPWYVARAGSPRLVPLRRDPRSRFTWDSSAVAISRDGRTAAGVDIEGRGTVWRTSDGRPTRSFVIGGGGTIELDPAGRRAVIATDGAEATIVDLRTGRRVHDLVGHTGFLPGADWSADGRLVVTIGIDETARVWDAASGRELRRYALGSPAASLAVDRSGSSFAVLDLRGRIRTFDLCDACSDGERLLDLAGRRGRAVLTDRERTIIRAAERQ